jgi:hypothetical protein
LNSGSGRSPNLPQWASRSLVHGKCHFPQFLLINRLGPADRDPAQSCTRAAEDGEGGCLARASKALDSLDAVRRTENILDHALLCPVEMRVLVGNAVLPSYSIFRIVPQVHVLFQLWKFSFDDSMVGRYLTTDENTILQTPSNALILNTVQGWKGI